MALCWQARSLCCASVLCFSETGAVLGERMRNPFWPFLDGASSVLPGDGGSTKRSLGARIVQKSRENLQSSQAPCSSSSSSSSTTVAPTATSQASTISPGSDSALSGVTARLEYGRHSLKLPAGPGPAYSPSAGGPNKSTASPRATVATSSWQRRKDYDARKAAAVARQSSSGSLSSSGGHAAGPESGSSAGGSMESADPEISAAKMTRTVLSRDLEILAR